MMHLALFCNRLSMARLLSVGLLCSTISLAHAGLFDDEEARRAILDLRAKLEQLRQDVDQKQVDQVSRLSEDNAQIKRNLLDIQNQLEVSRAEIAKLRGQNEVLTRELSEAQRKQKDLIQSLDDRLRRFEPARITVDGREIMVEPAEKKDYEASLAIFRKADFVAATAAFVDFLGRNPQTAYRPSALFWLGNAQYATKDYKSAMANFRSLVASAPDHLRVPESLLAIANCQYEIKETKAARKTLEELIANYPTSEAANAAKDRLARFK